MTDHIPPIGHGNQLESFDNTKVYVHPSAAAK